MGKGSPPPWGCLHLLMFCISIPPPSLPTCRGWKGKSTCLTLDTNNVWLTPPVTGFCTVLLESHLLFKPCSLENLLCMRQSSQFSAFSWEQKPAWTALRCLFVARKVVVKSRCSLLISNVTGVDFTQFCWPATPKMDIIPFPLFITEKTHFPGDCNILPEFLWTPGSRPEAATATVVVIPPEQQREVSAWSFVFPPLPQTWQWDKWVQIVLTNEQHFLAWSYRDCG